MEIKPRHSDFRAYTIINTNHYLKSITMVEVGAKWLEVIESVVL